MARPDRTDIQGVLFRGYGHLDRANHLHLRFGDPAAARQWLSTIVPETQMVEPWHKPRRCLNIAFTADGLRTLGVSEAELQTFSPEFQQGMAERTRSDVLGDTGDSRPEAWEFGGPRSPAIHAVLLLFGLGKADLEAWTAEHEARLASARISVESRQYGVRFADMREPFGFRDGLSQPPIQGSGKRSGDHPDAIATGEFVLGYENEYGLIPRVPDPPELGHNGSYVVYRKLNQDVTGFWSFITQQAGELQALDPAYTAEWLGARMVGRWRSGCPVALSPDHDNPQYATRNDFGYADDRGGLKCPIGSHIRRGNPRDSLEGDPAASAQATRRHRLLRRSMPYGEPQWVPGTSVADGVERGLLFIVFNADLKRQFEFVQQTWVNNEKFSGLYDTKDPLVGDNDTQGSLHIPREPVRLRVPRIPRFVSVRGGLYLFLPSKRGLHHLAAPGQV